MGIYQWPVDSPHKELAIQSFDVFFDGSNDHISPIGVLYFYLEKIWMISSLLALCTGCLYIPHKGSVMQGFNVFCDDSLKTVKQTPEI